MLELANMRSISFDFPFGRKLLVSMVGSMDRPLIHLKGMYKPIQERITGAKLKEAKIIFFLFPTRCGKKTVFRNFFSFSLIHYLQFPRQTHPLGEDPSPLNK